MAQSYAKLQEKQRFDDLIEFLDDEFQKIPDHRTGNAIRYDLPDVLKSAFAMFSLKSPSLLDFKKRPSPSEAICGASIELKEKFLPTTRCGGFWTN